MFKTLREWTKNPFIKFLIAISIELAIAAGMLLKIITTGGTREEFFTVSAGGMILVAFTMIIAKSTLKVNEKSDE